MVCVIAGPAQRLATSIVVRVADEKVRSMVPAYLGALQATVLTTYAVHGCPAAILRKIRTMTGIGHFGVTRRLWRRPATDVPGTYICGIEIE